MFKNFFNRLHYILFAALIALCYRFYDNYFFFIFLILLFVFPCFSIPVSRYAARHLSFSLEVPSQIERFADVTLRIRISNPTFFPIVRNQLTLSVSNHFYEEPHTFLFTAGIAARKDNEIIIPFHSEYCGIVHISIAQISIWDYTGMSNLRLSPETDTTVCILPKALDLSFSTEAVGGAGLTELVDQEEKGNDSSQVIDTRDYQPGDKLQRIHWKLSIKLDKLLVKEYGSISSNDVLVLIDLYKPALQNASLETVSRINRAFDRIFDAYLTLANHLLREKRPFLLAWYSPSADELHTEEITNIPDSQAVFYQLFYESPSRKAGLGYDLLTRTVEGYSELLYIHPCIPETAGDGSFAQGELLFSCAEEELPLSQVLLIRT